MTINGHLVTESVEHQLKWDNIDQMMYEIMDRRNRHAPSLHSSFAGSRASSFAGSQIINPGLDEEKEDNDDNKKKGESSKMPTLTRHHHRSLGLTWKTSRRGWRLWWRKVNIVWAAKTPLHMFARCAEKERKREIWKTTLRRTIWRRISFPAIFATKLSGLEIHWGRTRQENTQMSQLDKVCLEIKHGSDWEYLDLRSHAWKVS